MNDLSRSGVREASTQSNFKNVYTRHSSLVRRVLSQHGVRPADIEDVTQETFITVFRLLPAFEGRASLETWLHAIAWRVAAGHRRRAHVRLWTTASEREDALDEASDDPLPVERLHASLARLREEDRDLIALHDAGGLSITELSELTGFARATVRQRVQRGRAALGRHIAAPVPSSRAPLPFRPAPARPSGAGCTAARAPSRTHVGQDDCIATVGNTIVLLSRGPSRVETLEVLVHLLEEAADAAPGGLMFLGVVERTSTLPSQASRQLMVRLIRTLSTRVQAAAWAAEGAGQLQFVVPLVNSCAFLGRASLNARFFLDVPAAAKWLALRCVDTGALEIERQVERMRGWLDFHPPR